MKMATGVEILFSLLLILHLGRAQKSFSDPINTSSMVLVSMGPQGLVSLLLLGLTVVLSASIYLWVLRYVCVGCCQPVAIGVEPEALAGMV